MLNQFNLRVLSAFWEIAFVSYWPPFIRLLSSLHTEPNLIKYDIFVKQKLESPKMRLNPLMDNCIDFIDNRNRVRRLYRVDLVLELRSLHFLAQQGCISLFLIDRFSIGSIGRCSFFSVDNLWSFYRRGYRGNWKLLNWRLFFTPVGSIEQLEKRPKVWTKVARR